MIASLFMLANLVFAQTSPKPFLCNGYYGSHTCQATLNLADCKQSITLHWPPLRLPGNPNWAKTNRTWCTVTFDGKNATENKKYPPAKCDELVKTLSGALQGFAEIKWQDAKCTLMGSENGFLYLTQNYDRPKGAKPKAEPEPVAVQLGELSRCIFYNPRKRQPLVRCPVLTPRIYEWSKKYFGELGIKLEIQNPPR